MRLLLSILFVVVVGQSIAQDSTGTVFVSNDYRSESNTLVVKWFAHKIYYQKGFDVYRQEKGSNDWTKVNAKPINMDRITTPVDSEVKSLMKIIRKQTYKEFQTNVARVFALIKAVYSDEMAKLLGVIYFDATAEAGKTYRYKVVGKTGVGDEYVNTTSWITDGAYQKRVGPRGIKIERKKGVVNLNWTPEEGRYYGVHIYRSTNGGPYEKITEQARAVQKSADQNGKESYPEIFYEDFKVTDDTKYSYKLTAVDYFGQESDFSKVVNMQPKDFVPPPAPVNLKGDARLLDVTLTWDNVTDSDVKGYNVYRFKHFDDPKEKLTASPLPVGTTTFQEKMKDPGVFYYQVASVDAAGNEGNSGVIVLDVHDLIPPAIPKNVFVKTDTGRVTLSWDEVLDDDLLGYYIYKSLDDGKNEDNEFAIVNKDPISGTSYTEELPKGVRNKFVYKVVSCDSNYNRSEYSALSVVKLPDVTPPIAPFLINISETGGTIKLEWLPSHERDLEGYKMYRSSYEDSANYELISKLIPPTAVSYEDHKIIKNMKYHYYLKAVDNDGNLSEHSNIYEGKVIENHVGVHDVSTIIKEIRVKYNKKKKKVFMTWELSPNKTFMGYVIMRGEEGTKLKPITGLKKDGNKFEDKALVKGRSYIYQIRIYQQNGDKTYTDTFPVTIKE